VMWTSCHFDGPKQIAPRLFGVRLRVAPRIRTLLIATIGGLVATPGDYVGGTVPLWLAHKSNCL
jgi:hypothetical protein